MRNITIRGLVADCLGPSVLLSPSIGNGRLKYEDRLKIKGEQRGFYTFVFQLQPHTVWSLSCIQGGNFVNLE